MDGQGYVCGYESLGARAGDLESQWDGVITVSWRDQDGYLMP